MCLFVAAIRTRAGLLTLQQQGAAEPHESPSIAEHQNPPYFRLLNKNVKRTCETEWLRVYLQLNGFINQNTRHEKRHFSSHR